MKKIIVAVAILFLLALVAVIVLDMGKQPSPPKPTDAAPPPPANPADAAPRQPDDARLAAARAAAEQVVANARAEGALPAPPQAVAAPAEPPKHNVFLQGNVGIFDIILKGDMEVLRALVETRPDSVNDRDRLGDSPLHHAVARNRADMVDFLLSYKADIHAKNIQGETPLHTAAGAGLLDMVRLLLHHGADVNIRDGKLGLTPMTWAALFGRREVVEFLRQNGAK